MEHFQTKALYNSQIGYIFAVCNKMINNDLNTLKLRLCQKRSKDITNFLIFFLLNLKIFRVLFLLLIFLTGLKAQEKWCTLSEDFLMQCAFSANPQNDQVHSNNLSPDCRKIV